MSDKEIRAVERTVNEIIKLDIPVGEELVSRREADEKYFTGKLPEDAGEKSGSSLSGISMHARASGNM